MSSAGQVLLAHFPDLDTCVLDYIESVISNGTDDFDSGDDVFDFLGELLIENTDVHSRQDVKEICHQIYKQLIGSHKRSEVSEHKILPSCINIGESVARDTDTMTNMSSIWMASKEVVSQVDQKKLEKAEAKLKMKQDKRDGVDISARPVDFVLSTPTASQMMSKSDLKKDETGKSKDIKIENFDIAFGDRVLLNSANLTLSYGRRYGLVGRNGIGKSTLLKLISSRSLFIPKHITILHVEQEVAGTDTSALDAVLECDTQRESLLAEEKLLSASDDKDASSRLQQVYSELSAIEADKAAPRASQILAGLGFTPVMQKKTTKEFSGGWRMRISLARALFSRPDLLLLDEPTNMLDMKAIVWLEDYLINKWESTLLVVSHDRQFLNVVPTDTLHFYNHEIIPYKGNFDSFVKVRIERQKNQEREYEAQVEYRKHAQEFIDKFRYNAKRASLVQSKIKLLEKLPPLKPVEKEQAVVFKFEETEPLSGAPILQLDEVSFKYDSTSNYVLDKVTLNANLQSRITIVGDNGSGKTTLLKLLTGALSPSKGNRNAHRNLKIGYFTQHHVDQLTMNQSPLEFLASKFPGRPSEQLRAYLGKFGVTGDLSLQPMASLSGGQKSRVAFAVMSAMRPNILILDEPTNHLDVETVEALAHALNVYTGGVILVSHDEQLIKLVCKEMWYVSNGTVRSLESGFDEYRRIIEEELIATLAR